jgi:hypothetical protein
MKLSLRIHFITTILSIVLFILSLYGITFIGYLQSLTVLASLITFILAWKYASKDNIRWLKIYLRSLLFIPVVLSIISCIVGGGLLFIHFFFYMILFILGGGGDNGALYSKYDIKITRAFTLMTNDAYLLKRKYFLFDKTIGRFNYEDYNEFKNIKVTPLPTKDSINILLIETSKGETDTVTVTH